MEAILRILMKRKLINFQAGAYNSRFSTFCKQT